MRKRVLIVEDEALVALTLEDILVEAGYDVCGIAYTPAEALALARKFVPEIAVVDVRLADDGDGIALADALMAMRPLLILFVTGNPAEVRARARSGRGCLTKPFDAEWLLVALEAIQSGPTAPILGYFPLPFA